MKSIKKDELFANLGGFLKSKGIEFKDGPYAQRIQQSCNLLTDAINSTQRTVKRAKVEVDQKLEQLRQTVHDATAPKSATETAAPQAGEPEQKPKNVPKRKAPAASQKPGRKK